jgi:hypothetical protein
MAIEAVTDKNRTNLLLEFGFGLGHDRGTKHHNHGASDGMATDRDRSKSGKAGWHRVQEKSNSV